LARGNHKEKAEMAHIVNDFYLPGYITDALKHRGKYHVAPHSMDGVLMQHLHVDPEVVSIIGQELRGRREELLRDTDLGDQESLARMFSGLERTVHQVERTDSAFRKEAMDILPRLSGFSPQMTNILLGSFSGLTMEQSSGSIHEVMLSPQATSEFVETSKGYARHYSGPVGTALMRMWARNRGRHRRHLSLPVTGGPQVITNIAAGNVPGISIMETFLTMMVGAASLGKNASAEPYFGPRFLEELGRLEREENLFPLSDLATLVTFSGGERRPLQELIQQGDHLQVTGGHDSRKTIDKMVRRLRYRSLRDFKRRVSGHWHKVSFDIVSRKYLDPRWRDVVAFNVAFDNSMFNTQGCLSAQQVFVEGHEAEVLQFADRLLSHMRAILVRLPKGDHPHQRLRDMYHWYENRSGITILTNLQDMQEYPLFVAYDGTPTEFAVYNGLNRSIIVRRLENLETDLPRLLGSGGRRDLLQSCGAAIPQHRLLGLAETLGKAGVNRIVAPGDIWNLRLNMDSWDGYLPPTDLVAPQLGYWTTVSFQDPDRELFEVERRNQALLSAYSEMEN
jgi:hypothetical protein